MKRTALFVVLSLIFLEWLDFSLYLYLAKAVFAQEFFQASTHSLMLSFALFAAAYIARPVGGWLLGKQADMSGRRTPMVFSAALMGLATLGICVLPSYAQIGLFSTWGLLVLRIAQGLALGGEINTSAMFLMEHHPSHRLIVGSWVAASGAAGMFMGGMLAALVQYSSITWLWRVVFAIVGGLSLWICRKRKHLKESPEFHSRSYPSGAVVWKRHYRGLLNIAALGAYVSVTVYLCNAFWVSFAIDMQLWSNVRCAWTASLAQMASALLAIPIARFSKTAWHRNVLQASMVTTIVSAPLLFHFTELRQANLVLLALLGYVLANALLCSSLFYFLYCQLPSQYRCQGVSTVWAIAASLGALSLPIAEHAVTAEHFNGFPGVWVSAVAIVALVAIQINHSIRTDSHAY